MDNLEGYRFGFNGRRDRGGNFNRNLKDFLGLGARRRRCAGARYEAFMIVDSALRSAYTSAPVQLPVEVPSMRRPVSPVPQHVRVPRTPCPPDGDRRGAP